MKSESFSPLEKLLRNPGTTTINQLNFIDMFRNAFFHLQNGLSYQL